MGKTRELEDKCAANEREIDGLRRKLQDRKTELQQAKGKQRRQADAQKANLLSKIKEVNAARDALFSEFVGEKHKTEEIEERTREYERQVGSEEPTRRASDPESIWRAPTDDDHQALDHEALADIGTASHSRCPAPVPPETLQELEKLEEEAKSVGWESLHEREKQKQQQAQEAVERIHSEIAEMKASQQSASSEAEKVKDDLLQKQLVADKSKRDLETELEETQEKTEALQQKQDALERDAKALQHSLGNAMYGVGKKDREIQLKEVELREVRYSIHVIQDEMEEVNHQLQAQCDRVQRVESSLRLSRDLGSKVQTMRDMLKESHSALSQLCSLVERERSQREQCSQGLRQQQLRTELLLQLLHHFKNRTQDLAPQALLSQAAELLQSPKALSREPETFSAFESQSPYEPRSSTVPPPAYSRGRY